MECICCAFPNPIWKLRCGRCDRRLHSTGTLVAVGALGAFVVIAVAVLLLSPS